MSETVQQIYIANPSTVIANNDLIYIVQSPYTPGTDSAIIGSNLKAMFLQPSNNLSDLSNAATARTNLGLTSIATATPPLSGTLGGTGVNNGASTITIGGNVAFSGAFTFTGTLSGNTSVTFPTSGTLATTSQLPTPSALTKVDDTNVTLTLGGTPATSLLQAVSLTLGWTGQLGLTRGGTNASLTASNGGIVYSTASALAILAGTATARQMLQSAASTTPAWSTTTWPATSTINRILYSSSANVIDEIATANSGALITSAGGVPSISSTLPTAVQSNITQLGSQSQALNMNSHQINNVTDPTSAQDAATKNYVDTASGGFTPIPGVIAGTTANLNATYLNGVAGVGATLTNAGSLAAFSVDGVSPAINSRILVKDQTSALQNGIYTLTTVGSGAIAWVLTRATDYDQPAEINPGDIIFIETGTVNAGSTYYETATVTTIGVDSISFSPFFTPATYLKAANNLSDVASAATSRTNLGLTSIATATPPLSGTLGGTGVNNGANTITLGGNISTAGSFTTSGAFAVTQTYSGATNVTFPTSGTLATTSQIPAGAALTKTDDTNVTLTLGGSPTTALVNAASLTLGWTGTLSGTRGGTGVNNGSSTFTIGGNVTFSGAFTFTGTLTANTSVTFPTSGTLLTSASINTYEAEGRLTLTSGTPVTTADVTAATTLHYALYKGDHIALFDGSSTWTTITFTELSIAVPSTTNTMYDVFIYNNSGTATLETLAWTNDTTRATALTTQNGVYVKTGATTRRYVGSFRTTGVSGQTENSYAKRYVWNYYNRVVLPMRVVDTANTWNYSTASFRQANANTANQLDYVQGVSEDALRCSVFGIMSTVTVSASTIPVGIGLDSTTVNSANVFAGSAVASSVNTLPAAFYESFVAAGRHTLVWLEQGQGSGTQTWYGDNGGTAMQSGITGWLKG